MKFINLTPHAIVVRHEDNSETTFAPSGTVARVESNETEQNPIAGIPIFSQSFGQVYFTNKTEQEPNIYTYQADTVYIVSAIVLAAIKTRWTDTRNIVAPNTSSGAIRNQMGLIVAVTSFVV